MRQLGCCLQQRLHHHLQCRPKLHCHCSQLRHYYRFQLRCCCRRFQHHYLNHLFAIQRRFPDCQDQILGCPAQSLRLLDQLQPTSPEHERCPSTSTKPPKRLKIRVLFSQVFSQSVLGPACQIRGAQSQVYKWGDSTPPHGRHLMQRVCQLETTLSQNDLPRCNHLRIFRFARK